MIFQLMKYNVQKSLEFLSACGVKFILFDIAIMRYVIGLLALYSNDPAYQSGLSFGDENYCTEARPEELIRLAGAYLFFFLVFY